MSKNSNTILLAGGAVVAFAILAAGKKTVDSNEAKVIPIIKGQYDGKPSTFIKLNYPYALMAQRKYLKVPVDLILAQSGLESQWGKHGPGFNYFGIKADKGWKGDKQLLQTTEIFSTNTGHSFPEVIKIEKMPSGKYHWTVKDYFRKYASPLEGYLDYCRFITSGRYKNAYESGNLYTTIDMIAKDGYATDPNYASKLKNLASIVDKQVKLIA
jgi:flagellum-specific peptidoglycan hydrolase FlgJ